MYRDGLIPVALAHSKAAYPIGVGTDVLRLVAKRKLGLDSTVPARQGTRTGMTAPITAESPARPDVIPALAPEHIGVSPRPLADPARCATKPWARCGTSPLCATRARSPAWLP